MRKCVVVERASSFYTCGHMSLSIILLDRENSVNKLIKVKLVFSKWRHIITPWFFQFELVILR